MRLDKSPCTSSQKLSCHASTWQPFAIYRIHALTDPLYAPESRDSAGRSLPAPSMQITVDITSISKLTECALDWDDFLYAPFPRMYDAFSSLLRMLDLVRLLWSVETPGSFISFPSFCCESYLTGWVPARPVEECLTVSASPFQKAEIPVLADGRPSTPPSQAL